MNILEKIINILFRKSAKERKYINKIVKGKFDKLFAEKELRLEHNKVKLIIENNKVYMLQSINLDNLLDSLFEEAKYIAAYDITSCYQSQNKEEQTNEELQ
jgi:hypothetical protein